MRGRQADRQRCDCMCAGELLVRLDCIERLLDSCDLCVCVCVCVFREREGGCGREFQALPKKPLSHAAEFAGTQHAQRAQPHMLTSTTTAPATETMPLGSFLMSSLGGSGGTGPRVLAGGASRRSIRESYAHTHKCVCMCVRIPMYIRDGLASAAGPSEDHVRVCM